MAEIRTAHPYYMYDAIQAQPATWRRLVAQTRDKAHEVAQALTGNRRIYLVGTGTSFHAAQTGENIFRAISGLPDVRAITAFDFALYTPALSRDDAVIVMSHRGTKTYSLRSLEIAQGVGCRTVLITGEGPHTVATPGLASYIFVGVPQEISSAHTVSYTASVAMLSAIAQQLGRVFHAPQELPDELLNETMPRAIEGGLATEPKMARLAQEYVGRRRIWIVGAGPAAIVATETALKIKEAAYLQAEGLQTETMVHGPFQAVEADDVFVLIAPDGPARERTMQMTGMIDEIGAAYFVVSDQPPPAVSAPSLNERSWVQVPPVPEAFTTLTTLVPMQLFTYHLALQRKTNPDIFRKDDPRFARVSAKIKL